MYSRAETGSLEGYKRDAVDESLSSQIPIRTFPSSAAITVTPCPTYPLFELDIRLVLRPRCGLLG